jgi:hypothetical protein
MKHSNGRFVNLFYVHVQRPNFANNNEGWGKEKSTTGSEELKFPKETRVRLERVEDWFEPVLNIHKLHSPHIQPFAYLPLFNAVTK